jgi:hypothetical protein
MPSMVACELLDKTPLSDDVINQYDVKKNTFEKQTILLEMKVRELKGLYESHKLHNFIYISKEM